MSHNIAVNNFDLIRLAAAAQVAVLHVTAYLSPDFNESALGRLLEAFPGVPIFFFISGF
jgi:peptidoglycan/LPS O-acetylase OafA/YrhL